MKGIDVDHTAPATGISGSPNESGRLLDGIASDASALV